MKKNPIYLVRNRVDNTAALCFRGGNRWRKGQSRRPAALMTDGRSASARVVVAAGGKVVRTYAGRSTFLKNTNRVDETTLLFPTRNAIESRKLQAHRMCVCVCTPSLCFVRSNDFACVSTRCVQFWREGEGKVRPSARGRIIGQKICLLFVKMRAYLWRK